METTIALEGAIPMKKLAAFSLALLMALSLTAASAQTYMAGNYYTIDYPDTLTLDDTSYTDENTEDNTWLYMLEGDSYLIDASISTASGYEGFSLYNASEADRQSYVDDTLDAYADDNATLVDTLTVGNVPFYIFSMEDSDGPYYYAETLANGASINFCCYYNDANATPDEALLKNLEAVLTTFKPASAGNTTSVSTDNTANTGKADAISSATTKKN